MRSRALLELGVSSMLETPPERCGNALTLRLASDISPAHPSSWVLRFLRSAACTVLVARLHGLLLDRGLRRVGLGDARDGPASRREVLHSPAVRPAVPLL